MRRTGRNDPCPCGSGKKFKKCCESKMLGGKFMATKIDTTSTTPPARLTGLFRAQIAPSLPSSDTLKSRVTRQPTEPAKKPAEEKPPKEQH